MASLFSGRRFVAQSRRWERRLIFIAGAFVLGLVAVALAGASDEAQDIFGRIQSVYPYAAFAMTPLGFGLSAWLVQTVFPNTQGSGIPQAIAARSLETPEERSRLVGLRVAVGKVLLTLLGLLCGASIGREGPTVQVGASVMYLAGRLTPHRQKGLILAGAAAGVAAAFNTPLAGIVFAIEEVSRTFEARTSGLILGAVILAGMISQALLGDYSYFGSTGAGLPIRDWAAVLACGVAGGVFGGAFSRMLIVTAEGFPGKVGAFIKKQPVLFAVACGLAVAVIGFFSHGQTFGTGYTEARNVVHGSAPIGIEYAPLKFLASTLSAISGIPGGIFAPSLSVGAGMGSDLSVFFPSAPLGAIVLLGMVGYFSGVVQAPITSFVIVSEMTSDHHMLLPLMATALVATAASRTVCPEGVYHALSRRYLAPGHQGVHL
jgi:H+/Cl- antiporter ClcA